MRMAPMTCPADTFAAITMGVALALATALVMAGTVRADGAPESVCDIRMNARMSVYTVVVDDEPWQGKSYLTWDDAVKLRDVLVSAGACERAAGPRPYKLELIAAGNYAILRDGVNFDPYAKLRTMEAARKYAGNLEKAKLCRMVR